MQQYADSPSPDNPVTTARNRIELYTHEVAELTGQVRRIADAMFGAIPSSPPKGNPAAITRMGEAGLLHEALDMQGANLQTLREELARLSDLGIVANAPTFAAASGTTSGVRLNISGR